MKKAFTLVELLVVIGIIGILSSILMITMGGGTESSRNAKCISNLANLAKATTAQGQQRFPFAGSIERKILNSSSGSKATFTYKEEPGWLSWYSNGAYGKNNSASGHLASSAWFVSAYTEAPGGEVSQSVSEMRHYCITNSALKAAFEKSSDILVCPQHKLDMKNKAPFFSYAMNSYFKWDDSEGSKAKSQEFSGVRTNLSRADRILLFAELPWKGWAGNDPTITTSPGTECDCTLQYKDPHNEVIGFNHKKGKAKVAHVAFADGHTETIQLPKNGMSQADLEDLTKWLCEGKDISFENGQGYKLME